MTREKVLIICLLCALASVQAWNTHRINNLIDWTRERTAFPWRADAMQQWIDETQRTRDAWCEENHLTTYRIPSTTFGR